jgi:hypothetical protein
VIEANYFAAVSVYMNARVEVNLGQTGEFKYYNSLFNAED